jgi:hypothetical protein
MRKGLAAFVAACALALATIGSASAHVTGPCGPDGTFAGAEYAAHHISAMAKEGLLGNAGHKPGVHQGYSLCLGVHE